MILNLIPVVSAVMAHFAVATTKCAMATALATCVLPCVVSTGKLFFSSSRFVRPSCQPIRFFQFFLEQNILELNIDLKIPTFSKLFCGDGNLKVDLQQVQLVKASGVDVRGDCCYYAAEVESCGGTKGFMLP